MTEKKSSLEIQILYDYNNIICKIKPTENDLVNYSIKFITKLRNSNSLTRLRKWKDNT